MEPLMAEQYFRLADVKRLTGLSRSSLYEQMQRGVFPRPIRISTRAVAWRESDIVAWQDSRSQTAA